MRIGLIRKRYTGFGGAEVYLCRLIRELKRRGHDIDLFSSEWKEEQGVNLHKVNSWGPSFVKNLSFALNAKRAVEEVRPDIVVSLDRTFSHDVFRAGDGFHKEWLAKRLKTVSALKKLSIILSLRHRTLFYLDKKIFDSKRLKYAIAVSERGKREIMRHYGLPPERIYVIYNGIDLSEFSLPSHEEKRRLREDLGMPERSVVVMFVGSGFERKGLLYLIRAIGLLKDRAEIRLLVVGKGSASKYMNEAARLGIADRVVFKGAIEGAVKYYPCADIFALPSLYEPFGNACLEAMACGLPVVASEAVGVSEMITHGVNGAVVKEPTDPVEIAENIAPFLDAEKRKEAGRLARLEAEKHTIDRNVDEFLELLRKASSEKVH